MLKPGERVQVNTKNPEVRGGMGEIEGVTGVKSAR